MTVPLFDRKRDSFLLWCPSATAPAPKLIIGRFSPGNPPKLADEKSFDLSMDAAADLWVRNAADCHLQNGVVYHYWFEVNDTNPINRGGRIRVTPPGRKWKEIAQERDVPMEWVGREPIYPREAKVYALVDG